MHQVLRRLLLFLFLLLAVCRLALRRRLPLALLQLLLQRLVLRTAWKDKQCKLSSGRCSRALCSAFAAE